ncbi:MAG: serine hydrolase domain-containing protein [Chloroflexota bacterium]
MTNYQVLEEKIQSAVGSDAILGLSVAIIKGGEIEYLKGFGSTSVEDDALSITPLTLFDYGSISKNLCAVLVMRLVEQGLLELDAPILNYLPDLRLNNTEYGSQITLRHLLSHTSGLPCAGKEWGPRDLNSLQRSVYEQIPHYEFLAPPGTFHLYANTVICVAGHIAEVVTGKFYDELLQEQVFEPLQMTRSTFDPTVYATYPIALPHEKDPDGDLRAIHQLSRNASGNPSSFCLGTASDLANLAQMYLNQGRFDSHQFLTPESTADMQTAVCSRYINGVAHPLAQVQTGYGLGFEVGEYRGRRVAGHGGMNMSYNCFFYLFPEDESGVVLMTNYADDPLYMEIVVLAYDTATGLLHRGIIPVEKPTALEMQPTPEELQQYVGTYVWIEESELATVTVENDTLVLDRGGNQRKLVAIGAHQFYAEAHEFYRPTVAFVHNAAGELTHAQIDGEPYNPIEFDHNLEPDLTLWDSFVGVYKDPSNCNLDEVFRVRLDGDTLYFAEGDEETTCTPVNQRTFLSDLLYFEFVNASSENGTLLKWGKAALYYPIDPEALDKRGVVEYLVDVPRILDDIATGLHLNNYGEPNGI